MNNMRDLLALPKADLHCHLEGCARPETIRELATKYNVELGRLEQFHNIATFLDNYEKTLKPLICSIDDLARIGAELVIDRAASGAVYCEPIWTPHYYTMLEGLEGITRTERIDEVFSRVNQAMQAAATTCGMQVGHIMGVSTAHPEDAMEIARFAIDHKEEGTVSFGMYGNENLEYEPFRKAAEFAINGGVLFVPHAGEISGAENVAEVITFGAQRISHGIRAIENDDVVHMMHRHGIACDIGLSSNLLLHVVDDLHSHPILQLIKAKISVTLGTDDSLFFNSTLLNEYVLARSIGLTDRELADIARNSIIFSGLRGQWRDEALQDIDEWLQPKNAA